MRPLDLDAYFTRIGLRAPAAPTLDALHAIVRAHVETIPFENVDVLLGRGVDLDLAAIERKLIHARRGGYCFEHNTLLLAVLEALGYEAAAISARVRIQRPREFTPPRTHVFVRVEIEGTTWLADVGVGALSPTAALRLDTEDEQATPHEPRRIVREGAWGPGERRGPAARLFHQARLGDQWQDVAEFTLEAMPPIDREVANWFTSAHPASHFRDRLMVARATAEGRVSLLNRELTVRPRDRPAIYRTLEDPAALLDALEEHFGIVLPRDTRIACPGLVWS